jgi:hypothetical protein
MMYRRKWRPVKAVRWFEQGDHPDVELFYSMLPEKYHEKCKYCGHEFREHGYFGRLANRELVCPGDWIVDRSDNGGTVHHSDRHFRKIYEEIG